MDIDKWTAEKCDLDTRINNVGELCYRVGKAKQSRFERWTIQDPRCREIVREHFLINTIVIRSWASGSLEFLGFHSVAYVYPDDSSIFEASGKTIPEAEIACIKAIYEAENGET